MCGVIGVIYQKPRADLGKIAGVLLKTLEYRGYDSTGAVLQDAGEEAVLRKGVGAPSVMVHALGIVDLPGQILCGQVRWATFGAVDEANAQPHVVRCHTYLYGAHNGNVTNCDALKEWLVAQGHEVRSDNDGEMVVHVVEHHFAAALAALPVAVQRDPTARRLAMRQSICQAALLLKGSYAAVIVDPVSRCVWSVKQGSSLYFGVGQDAVGGKFGIASSDLSSVLKLTRVLVPLNEGEFIEYDGTSWQLYGVADRTVPTRQGARQVRAGEAIERAPVRSRLRAEDTALRPEHETYMAQEIADQAATCGAVVRLFTGGSQAARTLIPFLELVPENARLATHQAFEALRDEIDDDRLRQRFHGLVDSELAALLTSIPADVKARGTAGGAQELAGKLVSTEAGFLTDLLALARDPADLLAVRLLDALHESVELADFHRAVEQFCVVAQRAVAGGGRIHVVCCGSSFHAAKAAAMFFNEIAGVDLAPALPGEFRGERHRSLRDADVVVAVSQSGETKDLIDVMNDVMLARPNVVRVALVNNVNSTLAQEKADLVLPLRCGPEIAVPATKSFCNQMAVFFGLALRLAEQRQGAEDPGVVARRKVFADLPDLVTRTLAATRGSVAETAEALYLVPSMHILGTRMIAVAKEGALKIREVVLNHTEGFEASEFKHGPNTILGWNTVWGPPQVMRMLAAGHGTALDGPAMTAAYADYPLVYVTGPEERDVLLTVSQINTHKIRGATTVIIAEASPALLQAAAKAPAGKQDYRWFYLTLPPTGDCLATAFSATVALQALALEMSKRKGAWLDGHGVRDHGVHPDVPKNVSKSITVD